MSEDRKKAVVEMFECGTSLAEQEYRIMDDDDKQQPSSKSSSTTNDDSSISGLREAIASDVLTSSDDSTTPEFFTSPYESSNNKQKKNYFQLPLIYCDQTASNRPVRSIENYIQKVCLPLYGNTHTNTSITGSQSTAFVAEARQIVAEGTNAKITGKASLDVVLFAGNGATSAVELLIDAMGLKHTAAVAAATDTRPVVFVGPYEHHSNLLPWRESGCEIVMVPECPKTHTVNITALEQLLKKYTNHPIKVGTFSAASNITGKVSDVNKLAATLHAHGALAFFDYATGAPYLSTSSMNMNPPPSDTYPVASMIAKDAIFLSPHKMFGGVGTPGVLIVKKHLVNQENPPSRSGGGTVFYVTNTHHRFLSNRIERFEGGTPNIVGILRTGLTFLLKRKIETRYQILIKKNNNNNNKEINPPPTLEGVEYNTFLRVTKALQERAPNLILLGAPPQNNNTSTPHLPIFSFLIRCGQRFLHYNYVCAILNDVFGIQSRGGCQCSGPYSQRVLGLTDIHDDGQIDQPNERNQRMEHALVHYKERAELLRPGFTRISLPFKGLHDEEVEYVIHALEWVAQNGWALMCQYRCNHRTAEWRHRHRQGKPLGRTERKWLSHYDLAWKKQKDENQQQQSHSLEGSSSNSIHQILDKARANASEILQEARKDQVSLMQALKMNEAGDGLGNDDALLEELRWYVYPKECALWLKSGVQSPPNTDTSQVLGAIQPPSTVVSSFNNEKTGIRKPQISTAVASSSSSGLTTIVHAPSRKRKIIEDSISAAVENSPEVRFRDGDHSGEVVFSDLKSNLEDGKLSQNCEIYDATIDSWLPIEEYLQKTSTATQKEEDTVNNNGIEQVSESSNESKLKVCAVTTDEKNSRKKPLRDSSQWGKSNTTKKSIPVQKQSLVETSNNNSNVVDIPAQFKKKRGKGLKPPSKMMRLITNAIVQWDMIQEGDRLLLGLSGGKDSISLLHCLLEFQRKLPINFEIEVCTIDPMTPSFDPSPLIPYVESLGLRYHYIRDDIVERANKSGGNGKVVSSLCAFCARMKRGNLYTCARRNNCNKLVLAQHLDDCAESFLMSVMHNGFLRTMKANYKVNAGDISVIRPMVYCRESLMTEFAKAANLPVINENCPACFEEPKERARIKKLLSREETLFPTFYDNIRRSIIPLLHEDATAILRSYTEEALAKSKREKGNSNKNSKKVVTDDEEKKDEATTMTESSSSNKPQSSSLQLLLCEASDDELIKEIARRRADKFRLAGSMKRLSKDDGVELPNDPTGQVCSLDGAAGTIPCRELME